MKSNRDETHADKIKFLLGYDDKGNVGSANVKSFLSKIKRRKNLSFPLYSIILFRKHNKLFMCLSFCFTIAHIHNSRRPMLSSL